MEFFAAPFQPDSPHFAVLSFVWQDDNVLLAHIADRGWCIPGGRIESGETPDQTAIRESLEEAGAIIKDPTYIGSFRITTESKIRWAAAFTSRLQSLAEFTPTSESSDRQFVSIEELAEIYYLWNPLTEAVFEHAHASLPEPPK